MEKACHRLCDESLKALFNLECTYSTPGLGFHLNHAGRIPSPAAKIFQSFQPKRLGKIHKGGRCVIQRTRSRSALPPSRLTSLTPSKWALPSLSLTQYSNTTLRREVPGLLIIQVKLGAHNSFRSFRLLSVTYKE